MKYKLYRTAGGNYNISMPDIFNPGRRDKVYNSGSIKHLKDEINKIIYLYLSYLQDEVFTDAEKEKFKKQVKIYRRAIVYLEKKAVALSR